MLKVFKKIRAHWEEKQELELQAEMAELDKIERNLWNTRKQLGLNNVVLVGVGGELGLSVTNEIPYKVGLQVVFATYNEFELQNSNVKHKFLIPHESTWGSREAGFPCSLANQRISEESILSIQAIFQEDVDCVIIVGTVDSRTATKILPMIAKLAKDEGVLTVCVVNHDFSFTRQDGYAEQGIEDLSDYADRIIITSNDRLVQEIIPARAMTIAEMYQKVNHNFQHAIEGIISSVMGDDIGPFDCKIPFAKCQSYRAKHRGRLCNW